MIEVPLNGVQPSQPSQLVGPDGVTPAAEVAAAAPVPEPTLPAASDTPPLADAAADAPGTVGAINRISAIVLPLLKSGLEAMTPVPTATDVIFTLASIAAQAGINIGMKEADVRAIIFRAIQIQYAMQRPASRVLRPDFGVPRNGHRNGHQG